MSTENQPQMQAKPVEESIEQIEEDLHFLNWQISKLEKMLRKVLKRMNTIDLSIT